ncbi:hypothetical protein [Nocardia sp. NBC_01388]|uniref:hypothetical protein n=1 Tax=Nocardia sp. NBC_01388 TaxID=2903596 RepID=UPI003254EB53
MANKRPVNRVSPKRRPAAQRSSGSRTTAADLRGAETPRPAAERVPTGARGAKSRFGASRGAEGASRGPDLSKKSSAKSQRTPSTPGGVWRTWRTAILCTVAAVLLAVVAIVGFLRPGANDSNQAFLDNSSTNEVKAAATNALTTLYAYKADSIDKDKWKAAVSAVVTEKMSNDFQKYMDTTVNSIKQAQADTVVKTDPIGVTMLTADRAELLLNLNVSTVKGGQPAPLASGPIVLRMQKINGHWLASEIADN